MKYNRKSIHLKYWNYENTGYYFITVCIHNRQCLLGRVVNHEMVLNVYGEIVKCTWLDLINHNPVYLDEFIIMPNHIHGIIVIRAGLEPAPTKLSEIIRQFKTFSAKRINSLRKTPGIKLWQRNYYEHIIRNDKSLHTIRQYINKNTRSWQTDKENPETFS